MRGNGAVRSVAAAVVLAGAAGMGGGVAGPAAASTSSPVSGGGSTWMSTAQQQWVSVLHKNGVEVTYTAEGAVAGRQDFSDGAADFAAVDVPYGHDAAAADSSSRPYAYVPTTAGAVGLAYNLVVDGTAYTGLRLSPSTITGIFTGAITDWDDPAVTEDDNGVALPEEAITPVVRSDSAGSTLALTRWLDQASPKAWESFAPAGAGVTSIFPAAGPDVAVPGAAAVTDRVERVPGSIGYDEQAAISSAGLPSATVLNAAGWYAGPSPVDVAVALQNATVTGGSAQTAGALPDDLRGAYTSTDPRAYPISYAGYDVIPTAADDAGMTTAKRQSLADFLGYGVCGGQRAAGSDGYAPMPPTFLSAAFAGIGLLKSADPGVDLTGIDQSSCTDPAVNADGTFAYASGMPPAACDQQGAGPCDSPPGIPQDVHASPSPTASQAIDVTWDAPAAGPPPTGYVVSALPGGAQVTIEAPARAATFLGLDPSTPYRFSVTAVDGNAGGQASPYSAPTLPSGAAVSTTPVPGPTPTATVAPTAGAATPGPAPSPATPLPAPVTGHPTRLSLRLTLVTGRTHGRRAFREAVVASAPGRRRVQLQLLISGRWRTIATVRTDAHGRVTLTHPFSPGRHSIRVITPASADFTAATSPQRVVVVAG